MRKNDRLERRLKLHDLRVLMTVIQAGSMLKAAQRLNTSQPAVSRSIAELEHALDVRLLDRSRQGVAPTIYGRALLDCGTSVFDELRQGIKNIEFLADPAEGELRIGASLPAFSGVVPATIKRLRRAHPRIHVQTNFMSDVRQQQRALRERTLDFVVGRLPPTLEKDFEAETLFQEGLVVIAGARNPWLRRRNVQLANLIEEPWLLPPGDSEGGALIAQAFRASGLELPRNSVAADAVLYLQSLIIGEGFLACYPNSPIRLGTMGPGFRVLPVSLPIVPSPFGIIRLRNRTLSPVAGLFIACAREVVKPLARGK
jgi:DNA-binding transcriptional LysR family regulator